MFVLKFYGISILLFLDICRGICILKFLLGGWLSRLGGRVGVLGMWVFIFNRCLFWLIMGELLGWKFGCWCNRLWKMWSGSLVLFLNWKLMCCKLRCELWIMINLCNISFWLLREILVLVRLFFCKCWLKILVLNFCLKSLLIIFFCYIFIKIWIVMFFWWSFFLWLSVISNCSRNWYSVIFFRRVLLWIIFFIKFCFLFVIILILKNIDCFSVYLIFWM